MDGKLTMKWLEKKPQCGKIVDTTLGWMEK